MLKPLPPTTSTGFELHLQQVLRLHYLQEITQYLYSTLEQVVKH